MKKQESKTWQEQFDEIFPPTLDSIMVYSGELKISTLRNFISDLVGKTRRETLQRAIELEPEDRPDRTLSEHMAFQDSCMKYKENLKKEMEK